MKDNLPAIITCALTGAELDRKQAPHLPITPQEIIQSALEAHHAGAAMVHLHIRDKKGRPTCDENIFSEVIQGIRDKSDLIIQVSTGGAIGDTERDRLKPLFADPDMASLSMGSLNFGDEVFLNPLPFIRQLANTMQRHHIKPEVEIFDGAMLETTARLIEEGVITSPIHVDFVLGVPGGLAASEENLDFLLTKLPSGSTWSVAAVGRHQFPMAKLALSKGGHVRVGMEDNLYLKKGVLARSNAELVAKVAQLIEQQGRVVATPKQARNILGLETLT